MRENTDQNISEYGHLSCSVVFTLNHIKASEISAQAPYHIKATEMLQTTPLLNH